MESKFGGIGEGGDEGGGGGGAVKHVFRLYYGSRFCGNARSFLPLPIISMRSDKTKVKRAQQVGFGDPCVVRMNFGAGYHAEILVILSEAKFF